MDLKFESVFIDQKTYQLHLKRIYTQKSSTPLLCLHGMMGNGKIFYSHSGKRLAPFLAKNGYDVFVADFRGQGSSTPHIQKKSDFGQMDIIKNDFELYFDAVLKFYPEKQFHCMAHSWGGVLLFAHLARFPKYRDKIKSVVLLGTKRTIRIKSLEKILMIDLVWSRISKAVILLMGYLPAKKMKLGSDPESRRSHRDCVEWVYANDWRDTQDGFDYGTAIKNIALPPTLSLTGAGDSYLGHPSDALDFVNEIGPAHTEFKVLGKSYGNLHDYDHLNLLTHPHASQDQYPLILKWLNDPGLLSSLTSVN